MKNQKLYNYLCDSEQEVEELNSICERYENEYDRLTNYRKSRIFRKIGQVKIDFIRQNLNRVDSLKDILQKMFGDFIENEDVQVFIERSQRDLSIIDKICNLHNRYSLEKLHNLLLVV